MNPLVNLAKIAVENYIKEGKIISLPGDLPEEFLKKMTGTFVTIKKQISIACQKGGINPIKEKIFIYKFTVEKYQ